MADRILFLDIDGVLNSAEWFLRMNRDALSREPIHNMLDPECVRRLNGLLEKSRAQVVVSSSWRILHSVSEIEAALKTVGFVGSIIGSTPKYLGCRGAEIAKWLWVEGRAESDIAILDDDSDMAHLTPFLVRTSWSIGLTDRDCERAMALFAAENLATKSAE